MHTLVDLAGNVCLDVKRYDLLYMQLWVGEREEVHFWGEEREGCNDLLRQRIQPGVSNVMCYLRVKLYSKADESQMKYVLQFCISALVGNDVNVSSALEMPAQRLSARKS